MKRYHRYIPESPELLAAREAESNAHWDFRRWRLRLDALRDFRADAPIPIHTGIRFAPEAK